MSSSQEQPNQLVLVPATETDNIKNAIVLSTKPRATSRRLIAIEPNQQIVSPSQFQFQPQFVHAPSVPPLPLPSLPPPQPLQYVIQQPQMQAFPNGMLSRSQNLISFDNSSMMMPTPNYVPTNNPLDLSSLNLNVPGSGHNSFAPFDMKSSLSLNDVNVQSAQHGINGQYSSNSVLSTNRNKTTTKLSTIADENVPVGKVEPNDVHQKVTVSDSKGKVIMDNIVNELKMPIEVNEEKILEKKTFTEKQRYLGFSKKKFQIILYVLGGICILSAVGFAICITLLLTDSGTDYEWKVFGCILTGATLLFCALSLLFLLAYTHYKYNKYKELLDQELENLDEDGNQIQLASIKNIYKYRKPGMPNKLPSNDAKTPAPTLQANDMQPVSSMPYDGRSFGQPMGSNQNRLIKIVKIQNPNKHGHLTQPFDGVLSQSSVRMAPMVDPGYQIMRTPSMPANSTHGPMPMDRQQTGIWSRIVRIVRPKKQNSLKIIPADGILTAPSRVNITPKIIKVKNGEIDETLSNKQLATESNGSSSLSTTRLIQRTPTSKSSMSMNKKPVNLSGTVGEDKNVF